MCRGFRHACASVGGGANGEDGALSILPHSNTFYQPIYALINSLRRCLSVWLFLFMESHADTL